MLVDIGILIGDIELIGGARGCGQTGFALSFELIFLGEIALIYVRSVLKVFEELEKP